MPPKRRDVVVFVMAMFMVLSFGCAGWQFLRTSWAQHWLGHAGSQIAIFERMRVEAQSRMRMRQRPDSNMWCRTILQEQKHPAGSRLDRIVQQARASAIREIITELRKKTGEDLGEDPQPWIEKYRNQ
jgi:hypothetical protein